MSEVNNKTDVIVVSGFLGSGKSTVVNRLIPGIKERNLRTGALINDIGRLNVDAARIDLNPEEIQGYSSGCVCCERPEDLKKILNDIDFENIDTFLIEPSGAANPIEIISALSDYSDRLEIKHVLSTVPIDHYSVLKRKRSFRAGLQVANAYIATFLDSENRYERDLEELQDFLSQFHKGDVNLFHLDQSFSYETLFNSPGWNVRKMGIAALHIDSSPRSYALYPGANIKHEQYKTLVRPINPFLSLEEIEYVLKQMIGKIDRAKGALPNYGLEFDIRGETLRIYESSVQGCMPYIVAINQGDLPAELFEKLTNFSAEDISFAVDSATAEDYAAIFHYYHSRTALLSPSVNNVVQANFEATDEAYTAAKELGVRYGDWNAMRLALDNYNDVRLRGLEELRTSQQDNRSYVGVMLGSFSLQMLGEHDDIDFRELCDSKQVRKIEREVPVQYFEHLSEFGDSDFVYVRGSSGDSYSRYFCRMAQNAAKFVPSETRSNAARNMMEIYTRNGKPDIANLWKQSLQTDFGYRGAGHE